MKDYFYDIHCHVFNLSHPNLLLFVKRFFSEKKVQLFTALIFFFLFLSSTGSIIYLIFKNKLIDSVLSIVILCISILLAIFFLIVLLIITVSPLLRMLTRIPLVNRIINLISVMENNLGEFLLLMEKDLIRLQKEGKLKNESIIITPLMMDFGYKWVNDFPDIYYNRLSRKPIADQVTDLLNGIKDYKRKNQKNKLILEIYPFLGINTQNYPLQNESKVKLKKSIDITRLQKSIGKHKIDIIKTPSKDFYLRFHGKMSESEKKQIMFLIKDKNDRLQLDYLYEESNRPNRTTIKVLLDKYFKEFKIEKKDARHNKLYEKIGKFNGNLDDEKMNYNYFFAGIKVYPPLGFDPWPDDPYELEKVKYLYDFCIAKNIPLTTHCSGAGFQVIPNKLMNDFIYYKWGQVLNNENYSKLKINLAHFGSFKHKYAKYIFELILNHENVYADFSCQCIKAADYKRLSLLIKKLTKNDNQKRDKLLSRINFGSDFMINLFVVESYHEYLLNFLKTLILNQKEKKLFSQTNPERFLFGD